MESSPASPRRGAAWPITCAFFLPCMGSSCSQEESKEVQRGQVGRGWPWLSSRNSNQAACRKGTAETMVQIRNDKSHSPPAGRFRN